MRYLILLALACAVMSGCKSAPVADCSQTLYEVCYCSATSGQTFRQDFILQIGDSGFFLTVNGPFWIRPLKLEAKP